MCYFFTQAKAFNKKTLVTSSFDQCVTVWNVDEAKVVNQLKGKNLKIVSVCSQMLARENRDFKKMNDRQLIYQLVVFLIFLK